ncbi:MAG: flagellar biosynthesis anti-sigma factor FlgM [Armatimonadetes bacterium]|nr:flagellar biosynthesis anti-sigma factor FlgM [Armatimonadota bacterium]
MRIPPETIRSLVGLHTQRVARTQAVGLSSGAANVSRALSSDTVSLSDEAELLNTLKAGVKAMPEVDQARVTSTRQELASGTFVVNPERVAEGLVLELNHWLLLGNSLFSSQPAYQ